MTSADHSDRERLAMEYAIAMHADSNAVPDQLFTRLQAAFGDSAVVELTFLVGFINLLNWFNNALQIRYAADFAHVKVG